jgi:uncharacterized protein (DUF2267 family)
MTPVVDVKGLMEDPLLLEQMADQMRRWQKLLRREITDERATELEAQIKQFETVFSELKTALYAQGGPLHRTPPATEPRSKEEAMLQILNAFTGGAGAIA